MLTDAVPCGDPAMVAKPTRCASSDRCTGSVRRTDPAMLIESGTCVEPTARGDFGASDDEIVRLLIERGKAIVFLPGPS